MEGRASLACETENGLGVGQAGRPGTLPGIFELRQYEGSSTHSIVFYV